MKTTYEYVINYFYKSILSNILQMYNLHINSNNSNTFEKEKENKIQGNKMMSCSNLRFLTLVIQTNRCLVKSCGFKFVA